MENLSLKDKVEKIIRETLPESFYITVSQHKNTFSGEYIKIVMAVSNYELHNVRGQFPQVVSMCLEVDTMELYTQIYGGMGGQCITRKPNKLDPNESWLAQKSVKVPFRKPKAEEKFVLAAIKKFAENFYLMLVENVEVLTSQEYCDYKKVLGIA